MGMSVKFCWRLRAAFVLGIVLLVPWSAFGLGEVLHVLSQGSGVNSVAFSPDGTQALIGSRVSMDEGDAKLWNIDSGALIRTYSHGSAVSCVAFSPSGTRALVGGYSSTKLWDLASGSVVRNFPSDHMVGAVGFTPDATKLMVASSDANQAWIRDSATGATLRTFTYDGYLEDALLSSDGTQLVMTGSKRVTMIVYVGVASLWNVSTGNLLRTFEHGTRITSADLSPDGSRLVTGSEDGTIKLWNAETGAELQTASAHSSLVRDVSFSPDGSRVMTSGDNIAKLWKASTLELLWTFSQHQNAVTSVAISHGSLRALTGSWDGTAIVWSLSGEAPCDYEGLINDLDTGEGAVFMQLLPSLAPVLSERFIALGWTGWAHVDLERFDEYLAGTIPSPGDAIPDYYQMALVEYVLCHSGNRWHDCIMSQFEANRNAFRDDVQWLAQNGWPGLAALNQCADFFAAMLGASAGMKSGMNAVVLEMTGGSSGLPHAADYHVFGINCGENALNQIFAAEGDLDGDGLSNFQEYEMVTSAGGGVSAFVVAATDPYNFWPGNPVLPGPGPAGLAILTIVLVAHAVRTAGKR